MKKLSEIRIFHSSPHDEYAGKVEQRLGQLFDLFLYGPH